MALHRFLHRPDVFALLPEGSWTQGGCLTLAAALRDWIPGSAVWTVATSRQHDKPMHLFAYWGEFCLDGDGVSTRQEMIEKMKRLEGLRSPVLVPALNHHHCTAAGIPYWHEVKDALVELLRKEFGAFRRKVLVGTATKQRYAVRNKDQEQFLIDKLRDHATAGTNLYPLNNLLNSIAGGILCANKDPDIEKVLARGIAMSGRPLRSPGEPCRCHDNSAILWKANQERGRIATGYGLSTDGVWRQHTWVVFAKRRNPDPMNPMHWNVVETTIPRTVYYGVILDQNESTRFVEAQLG